MRAGAFLFALGSIGLLATPSRGVDSLEDLLRRLPDSANSVSVLRVRELFDSPMSQREGWSNQRQLLGVVHMPTETELIVTGSQWNPGSANRSWVIGQARFRRLVKMPDLAKREQSVVETIGGHPVVLTRRDSFFVELAPYTLGAMYPPDRRELGRWLRYAKASSKAALPGYLIDAAHSDSTAHLISAIDMEDLIDAKWLRTWLTNSKALKGKPANIDSLAKLIAGLKGIRLTVRAEDKAFPAQLRFDFSEQIGAHEPFIRPLFLEALDSLGAALEDFHESTLAVEGQTATLRCNLSRYGFARILMLILAPASDLPPEEARIAVDPALLEREASQSYYLTVNKLLDDLKKQNQRARDYNQTAVWHETYAKQIEQLPIAHVDKSLAAYGASVSDKLRALAGSLRGVPLQVDVLEGQKQFRYQVQPGYAGGFWGGWGYSPARVQFEDNFAQVQAQQGQVIVKDQENRDKLWAKIDEERSDIRLKMREKFKVDFDAGQ